MERLLRSVPETALLCRPVSALTPVTRVTQPACSTTPPHDRLIVEASKDLRDCDVIALAQFSIAATAPLVAEATGRPVVTTPDSAVDKLMRLLKAKV